MREEVKRPVGRPKITVADLPKNWREETIKLGESGASDVEIRVEALGGIDAKTFNRMLEDEPEFLQTITEARSKCEVWWQRVGRTAAIGQIEGFNATAWIFNMKNRFRWRDQITLGGDPENPIEVRNTAVVNVTVGAISPKPEPAS